MTNMEWCVENNIAATDLFCTRDSHRKPTTNKNSCYIIEEIHGLVYSEFEDNATIGFDKVILDWLATVCHNDCDAIYKAYHKGFLDGRNMKKEAEKADNKKSLVDEHEFESFFSVKNGK